jgi:hypothetical protein
MKSKSKALGLLAMSLALMPQSAFTSSIDDTYYNPSPLKSNKSPLSKKVKKGRNKNKMAKQSRKKNRK